MKKSMSGLKITVIAAAVMLLAGIVLVLGSVITAGPKQVLDWLEMPVYVSHDDQGWQVSTRKDHASPEKQVWEADADAVNGLLLHLVDADVQLRAVEHLDQVRLTWYESHEGEYSVELKDGILHFGHRELSGGVIGVQLSGSRAGEDVPGFCLEYPADKEWQSTMLVGVDADFTSDGLLRSRSTTMNLVSGDCQLDVCSENFAVVGLDYDITAALDCREITFDGNDVELELILQGEESDYSFAGEWMDTRITLNGRPLSVDDAAAGARRVTIDCMDAEVDIVTPRQTP